VPVSHLGAVAGVPDSLTFNRCFGDTSRVSAIDADLKIARTLDVPGTPGIILDGKLLGVSPGVAELESLIHRRLAQRPH
jgi:protein-disulfide isomerase